MSREKQQQQFEYIFDGGNFASKTQIRFHFIEHFDTPNIDFCHSHMEVTDGQVVRAGVLVTWNVLSWSGGHEFKPRSGHNLGCLVLLS